MTTPATNPNPTIRAPARVCEVLRDLHTQALRESDNFVSTDANSPEQLKAMTADRFVALEPDKCALVHALLCGAGARYIVEAGTSFGVSTIYLALAAGQNAGGAAQQARVIGTEHEPAKAARARENWRRCGADVEPWIDLRQGDLRETLKHDLPDQVDFLLLDIWTAMALPALKLVEPRFKKGSMIVADNIEAASEGYGDLLAHLNDPKNGYQNTVLPYGGGLLLSVYMGRE